MAAESASESNATVIALKKRHTAALKKLKSDMEKDCDNKHDEAIDELTDTLDEECEENLSNFKKLQTCYRTC